ncbi:MAG TPA: alpha/beta hydrolase [Thermoanaerobaculia bacterium]
MKRFPRSFTLHLIVMLLLAYGTAAADVNPAGNWKGAIELPGTNLDIIVSLTLSTDNVWTGTIDIPAQGLKGFALSGVAVDGARLKFEMGGIPGQPAFDGELAASGESIAGTFRQGGQTFPFSLQRRAAAEAAAKSVPEAPAETPVPGEGVVGNWLGTLDVGPMKLRLALHIEETTGGLTAELESIDQNSKIPINTVVLKESQLRLTLTVIAASYEGTLNADGSALEGVWTQGGQSLPLTFHRREKPFALNRPQLPKGPFPYRSQEVTFRSKAGDIQLAGTLLLPEGKGPFPAVAMATGSGPQDRDETLMGHKPFLVIADFLARRGIASLRFDDRGVGASAGDHLGSSVDDFAADVRAAVAFLRSREEIDRAAIGILGHSEGGLHGPMVAASDDSVAFLVLLAPPGEPLRNLLVRQTRAAYQLQKVDEELINRALEAQASDLDLIADTTISAEDLRTKLRERTAPRIEQFTAAERARLQIDSAAIERSIQVSTTAWFRSLIGVDPAAYLRTVKVPVLALFGEKDFQVDAKVNAAAVQKALEAAGNSDYDVHIFPGLNHLFQHSTTGSLEEYSTIEETFAPVVLERVGGWIEARFPRTHRAD